MRYIHNFFIAICIAVATIFSFGIPQAFAGNYISQIGPTSGSQHVEKLQKVFLELGLYDGKVDGNYDSIEEDLINYQIDQNIVSSKDHDHAGYFGKKTIASLQENYGEDFSELQKKYLSYEVPKKGTPITFEATAYYSALPGQKEYYMGSYEAELRLQGSGTMTASGVAPHVGTIAAPKGYAFGTKIYIEGYGVGVVEDRGGAIHGNRIDLWMGTGDVGRERALSWGRRTITGYIVEENNELTLEFEAGGLLVEKDFSDTHKKEKEKKLGKNKKKLTQELTLEKKKLIQVVAEKIKKLIQDQTNSKKQYTEQLQAFKTYITDDLLVKHREEEMQQVLKYLIEIL